VRMTKQTRKFLAVMLRDPGAQYYGLELAESVGLRKGTLYPALARLEAAGWLTSGWEQIDPRREGRPRRRYYRFTEEGAQCAHEAIFRSEQPVSANRTVPRPGGSVNSPIGRADPSVT
jgi:PadR family transcriptional regulator, regulatory protein PadR